MIKKYDLQKKPNEMNALTLAYIGDAIYEIYIRTHVISKGGKPNVLHKRTINYVSANAQAYIIHLLIPNLNDIEQEIVKRGRNAKSYTVPKNVDMISYRYSTGFEALVGYLYLTSQVERLEEIIKEGIKFIEGRAEV